jgi:hypothetical protein
MEELNCTLCNTKIARCNWARHLRSLKYQRNDPNQTITPRIKGRPKIKVDRENKPKVDRGNKPKVDRENKPKVDRRRRDVTCKDLLSQLKRYNIKGCYKLTKEKLLSYLTKVKKIFYKNDDLQQLTNVQLINIVKENNIKVNLKKKKDKTY